MTDSCGIVSVKLRQQIHAVAVGQSQVEQHQIEGPLADARQALRRRWRPIRLRSLPVSSRVSSDSRMAASSSMISTEPADEHGFVA